MKCPDDTALLVMQMAVGAVRSIADEFGGMTLSEFVVCCEAWWCTDWIGMEFFIADIVAAAGGVVVGGGGFKGHDVVCCSCRIIKTSSEKGLLVTDCGQGCLCFSNMQFSLNENYKLL
mmetsp:Transcript_33713/g.68542  ORF Transcript_33713/g.68542 Transcript_33713/m.68542 type:complete len:118 (+) Transcript_33713:4063-4416(+)